MRMKRAFGLGVAVLALSGCFGSDADFPEDACAHARANNLSLGFLTEDCMRLNEMQVLGTHNSYKLVPVTEALEVIALFEPDEARDIEYTHRPLTEQLEDLGIRQFEMDVFADPEGGMYADPLLLDPALEDELDIVIEDPNFDREAMLVPGYKVLHVQDIDYRSTCPTLISCLEEVRDWSVANPWHLPIMILVELKTVNVPGPDELPFVEPLPITPELLDDLDEELRSVFLPGQLITPDDVRGNFASLYEAIQRRGWPTLAQARGKVMFALDNTGSERNMYLDKHPNLEGAVMFVSSEPPEPTAGFVKRNNPLGSNLAEIQDLVAQGMVVRTRSDSPTGEVRSGDTTRRDAALMSGAQWVSTDYPEPSQIESIFESPFTDYIVEMPDGGVMRCNPVTTWPGCEDALLEP